MTSPSNSSADEPQASVAAPPHPSFLEAFLWWLKLGFISFGGPAGQISIMHQELVEKRRWISERRFLHALNYCMVLPGPEAQQLAIYIGWLLHRTWGGIVAGALFVLPSLFILAGLTWVYLAYGDVPLVQGIFAGIKPAVVAIVLFAAWRIGSRALKNEVMWGIAALSFIAIFVFRVPFPFIVLGAALLGMAGGKFLPGKFAVGGGHGAADKSFGAAVIDDDTRLPHTRYNTAHLAKLLGAGLVLWGAAMWLLPAGTLSDIGEFFTKAALVTFGGAYAVLP
ncbi:MAG: chromate transporter, partial [Azoarcus sp.]|nr:chromate transporter [Azoarcus sp.]